MKHEHVEVKRRYDDNGELIEESQYIHGMKNGRETLWYNGVMIVDANYRDGKLDGMCIEWNESGNKICESYFVMGDFDGPYFSWWDNGNKKEEGYYRRGARIGKYIYYTPTGDVWFVHDYGSDNCGNDRVG